MPIAPSVVPPERGSLLSRPALTRCRRKLTKDGSVKFSDLLQCQGRCDSVIAALVLPNASTQEKHIFISQVPGQRLDSPMHDWRFAFFAIEEANSK